MSHKEKMFIIILITIQNCEHPRQNRSIQIIIKICLQLSTYNRMNYQHSSETNRIPFSLRKAKQHVKENKLELVAQAVDDGKDQNQDTMTKPPKIKIDLDEQETKKIQWGNGKSLLSKTKKPAQQTNKATGIEHKLNVGAEAEPACLEIPYNKKIEQIMSRKPLRERLAGVLPPEMQLPISFDHQQLLKRMELMDRTMEFLGTHRNMKIFFFDAIRKSIFETNTILIEMRFVQQLLYLDEKCYEIEWRMNERTKKYDIKMALPKIESMDQRKSQMRRKIVNYLIYKEGEFLAAKKLTKLDNFKWHDEFDYKKVQIPEKSLPVHPNNVQSDLRTFPESEIEKIENPALKMLFKAKKAQSEVKSLSSASVADMILSRVPTSEISNQILAMVKEKERANNQLRDKQQADAQKVDCEAMLKIYDEILLVYMSKNVSNIFKMSLIEFLQQRLNLKDQLISLYVQKLLSLPGMNFLKVVQSSKKVDVVQIDKAKYKEVRNLVATSF